MSVNRTEEGWQKTIENVAEQSRKQSISVSLAFAVALICLSGAAIGVMYLVPVITHSMGAVDLTFLKGMCGFFSGLFGVAAAVGTIRAIWEWFSPAVKASYRSEAEEKFSTTNTLETLRRLEKQTTYDDFTQMHIDAVKRQFSKLVDEGYISMEALSAIMDYIKLRSDLIDLKNQKKSNPKVEGLNEVFKRNSKYAWNDQIQAQIDTAEQNANAIKEEIAAKKKAINEQFELITGLFDKGHIALPRGAEGYVLREVKS